MRFRPSSAAAALLVVCFALGCAAVRPTAQQPTPRAPTAFEQILVWDAAIARTNLAVGRAVIQANSAGFVPLELANRILTSQSLVADANRQLSHILQQGLYVTVAEKDRVKALIDQIQRSTVEMAAAGTLGIKDPVTAKAIEDAVQALWSLVQQFYSALDQLGVTK